MNWLKGLLFKDDIDQRDLNLERNLRIGKPFGVRIQADGLGDVLTIEKQVTLLESQDLSRAMNETVQDTIKWLRRAIKTDKTYIETGVSAGNIGIIVLNAWDVPITVIENTVMFLNSALAVFASRRFEHHTRHLKEDFPDAFDLNNYTITSRIFEFNDDEDDMSRYIETVIPESFYLCVGKPDQDNREEFDTIEGIDTNITSVLDYLFHQKTVNEQMITNINDAMDTTTEEENDEKEDDEEQQQSETDSDMPDLISDSDSDDLTSVEVGDQNDNSTSEDIIVLRT